MEEEKVKCLCGCGEEAKRRYLPGHNIRITNPMSKEEVREKVSIFRKGRFTGEENPFYGKRHTKEQKEKWSAMKKGENAPFYGKKHTQATKAKISCATKGDKNPMYNAIQEKNPNWKGKQYYGVRWARKLKREILERDNHKCTDPLCKKGSIRLVVHHIDGNKQNNEKNNLITLCSQCHNRYHHAKKN